MYDNLRPCTHGFTRDWAHARFHPRLSIFGKSIKGNCNHYPQSLSPHSTTMILLPSEKRALWQEAKLLQLAIIYQCIDIIQQRRREKVKKKMKKRSVWIKTIPQSRHSCSLYYKLLPRLKAREPSTFKRYMRFPVEQYEVLLEDLTPLLTKKPTNCRLPLSPEIKLQITVSRFAVWRN